MSSDTIIELTAPAVHTPAGAWSLDRLWAGLDAWLKPAKTPDEHCVLGVQFCMASDEVPAVVDYYKALEYGLLPVEVGVSALKDGDEALYADGALADQPEAKNVRMVTVVFVLPAADVSAAEDYYRGLTYGLLPVHTCRRRLTTEEINELALKQ